MAGPVVRARLLGVLCVAAVGLGAAGAAAAPRAIGSTAAALRGAPVALDELEAEQGRTNGSILGPSRTFGTLAAAPVKIGSDIG